MTSSTPSHDWAVLDVGPLIQLDRLAYTEVLPRLYQRVLLTPMVAGELKQGAGRPGSSVPDLPWAEVRVPGPSSLQRVHQELNAGAGEEETLALAVELGATVVLDDLKARRYAQRVGLSFTGTLGLLVEIHKRGLAFRSAGEDLDLLERGGMRLTPALQLRVLTTLR